MVYLVSLLTISAGGFLAKPLLNIKVCIFLKYNHILNITMSETVKYMLQIQKPVEYYPHLPGV